MLGGQWATTVWPGSAEGLNAQNPQTGVDIGMLREIGMASVHVPVDFVSLHTFTLEPLVGEVSICPFTGSPPSSSETYQITHSEP